MAVPPPSPRFAPWLDLRAHKIADPVARLRFLRQEMQALDAHELSRRRFSGRVRRWQGALGMTVALTGILAAAWPAGAGGTAERERSMAIPGAVVVHQALQIPADSPPKVWQVEATETSETYSNGLRVDLTFEVANQPRSSYPVFPLNGGPNPVRYQDAPAGIVFHTTESQLDVFDESENGRLKSLGRNLLEVVRQERAYHYVIDRFGRVYRVVNESDVANHSGTSLWADPSGVYVNLNSSFLAISFEGRTGDADAVTPAQIDAGRMLTEMLRSRYSIPASNCVTHAQVSVSASSGLIGNHTDWASQFPFGKVGLPDNYAEPLPSMIVYGFHYNEAFTNATGGRWKGLDLADAQVSHQAAVEGLSVGRYRAILQHRYGDVLNAATQIEDRDSEVATR